MRVGIGVSTAHSHLRAVREAIEKAKISTGNAKIDFVLLFTTAEYSLSPVLQAVREFLGPLPLLGASSTAVISSQGPIKNGLVIVLFSLNKDTHLTSSCVKGSPEKNGLSIGGELSNQLLQGSKDMHRNLSIVFSDLNILDNLNIIPGLQERLGSSFPIVGATLTNEYDNKRNRLYFGEQAINNASCAMLWGGKITFGLAVSHSWQPIGKNRYVTKSCDNVVNEIDDLPAANFYCEYFAKNIPQLREDLKHLGTFYPLGINVAERKEYLLRSVVSILEDGSLVFKGAVPQGSSIRLMISSKKACLQGTHEAASGSIRNMAGKKIKFALILNSLARYELLARQAEQEIKILANTLGEDTPLAGIYTDTEQGPIGLIDYLGKSYTHNNSIVILTIAD